jgi:hypothetical protein
MAQESLDDAQSSCRRTLPACYRALAKVIDWKHLRETKPPEHPIRYPNQSVELKEAWKIIAGDNDPKGFYTRTATVMPARAEALEREQVTVGLVGLHVVHLTPDSRAWVWATFEHIDNAPDCADAGRAGSHYNSSRLTARSAARGASRPGASIRPSTATGCAGRPTSTTTTPAPWTRSPPARPPGTRRSRSSPAASGSTRSAGRAPAASLGTRPATTAARTSGPGAKRTSATCSTTWRCLPVDSTSGPASTRSRSRARRCRPARPLGSARRSPPALSETERLGGPQAATTRVWFRWCHWLRSFASSHAWTVFEDCGHPWAEESGRRSAVPGAGSPRLRPPVVDRVLGHQKAFREAPAEYQAQHHKPRQRAASTTCAEAGDTKRPEACRAQ